MDFKYKQKILFKYCDPAGIVFYPRYFEMINDCVESFFADALEWSFVDVLKNGGVPTASIAADFKAVTRHGEELDLELNIERLGKTSVTLQILASCDNELRFEAHSTLVNVNTTGTPTCWPESAKSIFLQMKENNHDT